MSRWAITRRRSVILSVERRISCPCTPGALAFDPPGRYRRRYGFAGARDGCRPAAGAILRHLAVHLGDTDRAHSAVPDRRLLARGQARRPAAVSSAILRA